LTSLVALVGGAATILPDDYLAETILPADYLVVLVFYSGILPDISIFLS
jgi:hypothetical protein